MFWTEKQVRNFLLAVAGAGALVGLTVGVVVAHVVSQ